MNTDFLDDLFADPASREFSDGWTGWVPHSALTMPTAKSPKERPWCRGRPRSGWAEWFPRTSKPPWEGTRWAVHSPSEQLPGLSKPGWFVVNAYVRREAEFAPKGKRLGVLPSAFLEEIYRRLDGFYWDQRRGR